MRTERDSYIDYQLMIDGSNRWLWQVRHRGLLYRCGVEHQYDDARRAAHRAWQHLRDSLSAEEAAKLRTVEEIAQADADDTPDEDAVPSSLIV